MHLGQAGHDLFARHRQLWLKTIDHGPGQAGVDLLMFAEQRQVCGLLRLAKRGQFRAMRFGCGTDCRQRIGMIRCGEGGGTGLDDAGFFAGDGGVRFTEPTRVVEAHVGDHAGQRRDDVCRIEPAAHAGLPQHDVALLLGEVAERHHHDHLEKCRRLAFRKGGHPFAQPGGQPGNGGLGDQFAVYLHPLTKGNEVRRGEQPGAQAGLAVDRLEHRADRALAVRAGDVNKTQPLVRRTGQPREPPRIVQAKLGSEHPQVEQVLNGLWIGHFLSCRASVGRRMGVLRGGSKRRRD